MLCGWKSKSMEEEKGNYSHTLVMVGVEQAPQTCGPRATCGPREGSMRPPKHLL
jgi:hypothetical protein